jgi:transposase
VGRIARTAPSKHRPAASYRVHEERVTLYDKEYRAVVVHSSAHDKRRQKRLERELEASLKAIKAHAKAGEKRRFFCRGDAEAAANEILVQESACHRLKLRVIEPPRYAPGRPKHNGPRPPIAMEFGLHAEVIEKQHELDRRRQMTGCFVQLTHVPSEGEQGYRAEEILWTYEDQHAIERNFGFLKDDQIVNALFLRRPQPYRGAGSGAVDFAADLASHRARHTYGPSGAQRDAPGLGQ